MMFSLGWANWARLGAWLALGLCIYFGYSRRHSHLVQHLMHEIQAPRDESVDRA